MVDERRWRAAKLIWKAALDATYLCSMRHFVASGRRIWQESVDSRPGLFRPGNKDSGERHAANSPGSIEKVHRRDHKLKMYKAYLRFGARWQATIRRDQVCAIVADNVEYL